MAGRGAPFGNDYAVKGKQATDYLKRALAENDWKRLRRGCNAIANAFAVGEPWAVQVVFDRLDGKPVPVLPEGSDGQLVVSWVMAAPHASAAIEHADKPDTLPAPQDIGAGAANPALSPDHPLDVVVQAEK